MSYAWSLKRAGVTGAVVLGGLGLGAAMVTLGPGGRLGKAHVAAGSSYAVAEAVPSVLEAAATEDFDPIAALLARQDRERIAALAEAIWPEAQRRGISRELVDRAFSAVRYDRGIDRLRTSQPEHVMPPWTYLARLVSEARVADGRRRLAEHGALLEAIEKRYGVDRYTVLAIWGVESNFGTAAGRRSVFDALATLSVGDGRRTAFWRGELLAALEIAQSGDVSPERMTGSWAGAMGHTQFMPSSYLAHAVDFDGDRKRDIWGSAADALASTANFLKASGWRGDTSWGVEVRLPDPAGAAAFRPGLVRRLVAWQALGVTPALGGTLDDENDYDAELLLPTGRNGPAFLVSRNFRAILRYNNATVYALAVGHLSDRLRGLPPLQGSWPLDDPPLGGIALKEVQHHLTRLGHPVGPIDGIAGEATRAAVRDYQRMNGLPVDGYAGMRLLKHVRADVQQ